MSLREQEGWTLRVRTVDAQGEPVPWMPLDADHAGSRAGYALVHNGILEVPLLTGADGTATLPDLDREPVTVRVRIAGETLASATVEPGAAPGNEVALRVR